MHDEPDLVPAADVSFHELGDEGVLFCDGTQEIHALNALAARIWSLLRDGRSAPSIADALLESFDLSRQQAEAYIGEIAANWRALGLLRGSEDRRASAAQSSAARPDAPETGAFSPEFTASPAIERTYALLGSVFRVRFTAPEAAALVHQILGHLAEPATAAADVRLDVVTSDAGHKVYLDGREARATEGGLETVGPVVKGLVWQIGIGRSSYFLDIHAGVVRAGDACLLLPAASGSGKSCLTAALTHGGFEFMSDEVALLMPDLRVVVAPLSLCVKSPAWDIVARYYPAIAAVPTHHRGDGKIVRYLPPPRGVTASHGRSWPVRWLVFPRFDAEAKTELRPIGALDALARLLGQCIALPKPLTRESVASLVGWIGGLTCWELPMSSLDDAVALVREAVTEKG